MCYEGMSSLYHILYLVYCPVAIKLLLYCIASWVELISSSVNTTHYCLLWFVLMIFTAFSTPPVPFLLLSGTRGNNSTYSFDQVSAQIGLIIEGVSIIKLLDMHYNACFSVFVVRASPGLYFITTRWFMTLLTCRKHDNSYHKMSLTSLYPL